MDEHAQSAAVASFIEATGADHEVARFLLESSRWDVQLALSTFFEAGGGDGDDDDDDDDDDGGDADADDAEDALGREPKDEAGGARSAIPLAQRLLDSAEAVAPPARDATRAAPRPSAALRAFQGAGYSLAGGLVEPAAGAPAAHGLSLIHI